MRDPGAARSPLDPRLETFAAKFLDQRRWKKWRDDRKTFAGLKRIDRSPDF